MKKFNITGTCIPERHYMVEPSKKIQQIIQLIDEGLYFTINRPRQYGKTTTLFFLEKALKEKYLLIFTSFEGLGDEAFDNITKLSAAFIAQVTQALEVHSENQEVPLKYITNYKNPETVIELSSFITGLIKISQRKVVLMIDEVDKASNHVLFLNFLGMLRNKYLNAARGADDTFHSVVLVGVHDVKNIKKKIRPDSESVYNSPWNIASDFKIDMSFSAEEIETMLIDYVKNVGEDIVMRASSSQTESFDQDGRSTMYNKTSLNVGIYPNDQHPIAILSKEIRKFTSGYPFLVSKVCKVIDEDLDKDWSVEGIQKAISIILKERNTLFDDLIKNIENNLELGNILHLFLINGKVYNFNVDNPVIDMGVMYGIFKSSSSDKLMIHNKIFEVRIYNYLVSKLELLNIPIEEYTFQDSYLDNKGNINMEHVLLKFQEFIKNTYSDKGISFYERHGRLLLIAFIKPIINGNGFYYLEPQHSYERRSDMIITFNEQEYILELKLWYGQQYHEEGLKQLAGYLDSRGHTTGFLVAFNFNKTKEFSSKWNEVNGKQIFEVVV